MANAELAITTSRWALVALFFNTLLNILAASSGVSPPYKSASW